jgi:hypothetical protein
MTSHAFWTVTSSLNWNMAASLVVFCGNRILSISLWAGDLRPIRNGSEWRRSAKRPEDTGSEWETDAVFPTIAVRIDDLSKHAKSSRHWRLHREAMGGGYLPPLGMVLQSAALPKCCQLSARLDRICGQLAL